MGLIFSKSEADTDTLFVNVLRTSTIKKSKRSKLEKLRRRYGNKFGKVYSSDKNVSIADISEIRLAEDTTTLRSVRSPTIYIDQSCVYNGSFWQIVDEDEENYHFEQVPTTKQQPLSRTKSIKKHGFDLKEYFSGNTGGDGSKMMTIKPGRDKNETTATNLTRFATFHNRTRQRNPLKTLVKKPDFELMQIKVSLDREAADFGQMAEMHVTIASQEVTIDNLLFDCRTRLAKSMLPIHIHKNGIWALKYQNANQQWITIDRNQKAYSLAQTLKYSSPLINLLLTIEEIN